MYTRRAFLQTIGTAGMAAVATFGNDGIARVAAAARAVDGAAPGEVATDENFWRQWRSRATPARRCRSWSWDSI